MPAPFYMTQMKVFPFSGEVFYGGVTYSSAQMLWEALHRDANAYIPGGKGQQLGDRAPKPQVFRNDPEIEQYLARGGTIKRPEPKQIHTKVNLDDLDDLIMAELDGGSNATPQ